MVRLSGHTCWSWLQHWFTVHAFVSGGLDPQSMTQTEPLLHDMRQLGAVQVK
jgi:hypothetical protein